MVQRVSGASVTVEGETVAAIERGYVVLLGIESGDTQRDAQYCADKVAGLRIFEDAEGKMNRSLAGVGGAALVVSQFTLLGDARHGRRPSFSGAARPEVAIPLYEAYVEALRAAGVPVSTGVFQAHMQVALVNDGPVTILLDSKKQF